MTEEAGIAFPDDEFLQADATPPQPASESESRTDRPLASDDENNDLDSPSTEVHYSVTAGEEVAPDLTNLADSAEDGQQPIVTDKEGQERADEVAAVKVAASKPGGGKSRKKSRRRTKSARLIVRIPGTEPRGEGDISKVDKDHAKPSASNRDRNRVSFDKDTQQPNQAAHHRTSSAPAIRPQLQQPISNEVKMLQKLAELQTLLSRDYRQEAKICYRRGLAESGVLWRSYAAETATAEECREAGQCDNGRCRRLIARPETATNRLAGGRKDASQAAAGRSRVRSHQTVVNSQ